MAASGSVATAAPAGVSATDLDAEAQPARRRSGRYPPRLQQKERHACSLAVTTGTAPFPLTYATAELSFTANGGTNVPFSTTLFSPRVWNGSLFYESGTTVGTCLDPPSAVSTRSVSPPPQIFLKSSALQCSHDLSPSLPP